MIDTGLLKAEEYFNKHFPFIIYKPDLNSFDNTVPVLAKKYNLPIIKLAMHDLGTKVAEADALHFIKEVLDYQFKEDVVVWVEDISTIDDKESFIEHVLEHTQLNPHIRLIFTGIEKYCNLGDVYLPSVKWDTNYGVLGYEHLYIRPGDCNTVFKAPQALHFRVYANIVSSIVREFTDTNNIYIIKINPFNIVPLNSITQCASLAIQEGDWVGVETKGTFANHRVVAECIREGWKIPVKSIFNSLKSE